MKDQTSWHLVGEGKGSPQGGKLAHDSGTSSPRLTQLLHEAIARTPEHQIPGLMLQLSNANVALAARLATLARLQPHSDSGDEFLPLAALAKRIHSGTSTLRGKIARGELREGEHFVRK